MRHHTLALGLLFPVSAVLAGCGAGTLSPLAGPVSASRAIRGKAHGGQQPVAGAQIALYSYGTGGYGSAGTLLATAVTDDGGNFTIDSISCPSDDTPLYILSIGGNPGNPGDQVNSAINLGAGVGSCANASQSYVLINEISTAMLAYTFSHFFSTSGYDGITSDHFGAPSDQTAVISNGNSGTIGTLLDTAQGLPLPNTATTTFEGAKLITLGNIIASCVNSLGPDSAACTALFQNTQSTGGAAPTNTLEAAVNLAQNPAQNVASLFALQPASAAAAAFPGGLTSPPADWTVSASYSSSAFRLGVNARTVSSIDIDSNGRVWFPSNGPAAGVGYFDPSAGTFSQLFPGNLTHPQQVAIDRNDYVWVDDMASPNVAGYPASGPQSPVVLSLSGGTSTAVTIGNDGDPRFGIIAPDGTLALAEVTARSAYAEVPNTEFPFSIGFFASSLAGDVSDGFAIDGQSLYAPLSYDLYDIATSGVTNITYQTAQDGGQIAYNGSGFVSASGGYAAGGDSVCLWAVEACYSMANDGIRHPSGLAVDGSGTLWLADNNQPSIETIPLTGGSYLNANSLLNNTVLLHDSNNGGTLVAPAGIAVDRAGNVWVSNYGCYGNSCVPGSFVLSEVIGAAAPTTTPVSKQIFRGAHAGFKPNTTRGEAPHE